MDSDKCPKCEAGRDDQSCYEYAYVCGSTLYAGQFRQSERCETDEVIVGLSRQLAAANERAERAEREPERGPTMDKKCPKCGADHHAWLDGWVCGSHEWDVEVIQSQECFVRQLAAANERAERAEKALAGLLRVNCTPHYPDEILADKTAREVLAATKGGE